MTHLAVFWLICFSCWLRNGYGSYVDPRERSCQRCNITASSTASNCSLEMESSARNHTENCRDTSNHQYCYVLRTENNTKSYGCSWPTPDAKQYDPDIGSCDKDLYRSRVQQSNDTQCACSRNCSVGMFSFLLDDAEVPYDNSNDGRGDSDTDYVCKSECFIGIVTTSSILLLAIVCYTIYLCTHRKPKAVLNNSAQPKTVANSNLPSPH